MAITFRHRYTDHRRVFAGLSPWRAGAAAFPTFDDFTQESRERILIAMMKVNFLKRLESSVDSFRLTLQRKIDRLEQKVADFEKHVDETPRADGTDFDLVTWLVILGEAT